VSAIEAAAPVTTVLFDFAGVLTTSPWAALTTAGGGDLELMIGPYDEDGDHPWHRVERGEIALREWMAEVTRIAGDTGVEVDFGLLAGLLGELAVHDQVVARVRGLKAEGYRLGLITTT